MPFTLLMVAALAGASAFPGHARGGPKAANSPVTATWSPARLVARGAWGRMIRLSNGEWLCVSTRFARTNSALELRVSEDQARTWRKRSEVRAGRRFLDNGELIQLRGGEILLTGRSLIEGESYRLPVYRSTNGGRNWTRWSDIDSNEGSPGTLTARGLWEPHFYLLADGRLAVAYSNEKHAAATPAFSQVCSVRISEDAGKHWGGEITLAAEPGGGKLRPGMPVVTRMANGQFLAVYEVVGIEDADVFCKFSEDGEHWPPGLGTSIQHHHAGPWVTSLSNDRLLLTSCSNLISYSDDYGQSWKELKPPAWRLGPGKHFTWPAIYQTGTDEVAVMATWDGVHLRFGRILSRSR